MRRLGFRLAIDGGMAPGGAGKDVEAKIVRIDHEVTTRLLSHPVGGGDEVMLE